MLGNSRLHTSHRQLQFKVKLLFHEINVFSTLFTFSLTFKHHSKWNSIEIMKQFPCVRQHNTRTQPHTHTHVHE